MKINVLGLGESLSKYQFDGSATIGVNDIHSKIKTDYVVCVDHHTAFNPERLSNILKTKCKGFYSQVEEWKPMVNFNLIEFNRGRGLIDGLDTDRFCYSNNSTYVACVLAYKLGAKDIVMYGADFNTHPNFDYSMKEKVLSDFKLLKNAFSERGVNLFVGCFSSALSEVIPVYGI